MMTTKSGKPLSRIALGTLYFGTGIGREQSQELADTYLGLGGNQIDTARCYANWLREGEGASERTVGNCLKKHCREDIFLGTKGGIMPKGYNETRGNLSPENIEADLEASLAALDTDYVDLYWLHRDDYRYTAGEIVEMMNRLAESGRIRYYGVSNWTAERIRQARDYAKAHGLMGISASQIQYGLGVCTPQDWGDTSVVCMNRREYDAYRAMNLPVYAYSAQAEGYFSIYLKGGSQALNPNTRQKYDTAVNRVRARRLRELGEKKDFSLSWIMAEYVLSSPFPAVFILGGSSRQRLSEIMEGYRCERKQLTEQDWNYILE